MIFRQRDTKNTWLGFLLREFSEFQGANERPLLRHLVIVRPGVTRPGAGYEQTEEVRLTTRPPCDSWDVVMHGLGS